MTEVNDSAESIVATLGEYAEFYDGLSLGVMSFVPIGTLSVLSLDTYLMGSMASTLRGMAALVTLGNINDAYALARKLYDAALIGTYINVYLQRNAQPGEPLVASHRRVDYRGESASQNRGNRKVCGRRPGAKRGSPLLRCA